MISPVVGGASCAGIEMMAWLSCRMSQILDTVRMFRLNIILARRTILFNDDSQLRSSLDASLLTLTLLTFGLGGGGH